MKVKAQWECQECYRKHNTESEAISCHPPKMIYVCGKCGFDYNDPKSAELCCLVPGATPRSV